MGTIVGLEELVMLLDLGLVYLVRRQSYAATTDNLNVRGAMTKLLRAITPWTR
jgi:hypothetical protein